MPSPADPETPVWVVVVAGGSGARYGAAKQYETVAGRPVLDWSVEAARLAGDGVVIAVPADDVESVAATYPTDDVRVTAGGATRADSVRAGVAAVPDTAGIVLVHDAARPAATGDLFARVIATVRASLGHEPPVGAVPVVPVTDSLRHPDRGAVDRDELRAVQTPQGFPTGPFRKALAAGGDATDDATLFEAAGGRIVCVDGEVTNIKLTHPSDRLTLSTTLEERAAR